jgi:predicted short-subunit dehydrogenase-like oxidoreductase (DUF2520 family)
MRELERTCSAHRPQLPTLTIVGRGRLGAALAGALQQAGVDVIGPLGRGADGGGAGAVLLCVPDREIAAAARAIARGPLVGHCSGATGLEPLYPHECFSLHPLISVAHAKVKLRGAGAAVAGSSERALALARALAAALGLQAVEVAPEDRAAYHAAASIASNFLITLEAAAERLAASAGVERKLLLPLVRQTVSNWAALGAPKALTGPLARGDEATAAAQRRAVGERAPELLPMFDALSAATRELARAAADGALA